MWESDGPELVFILGRRRVGKSFVLVPFARAVSGIYYQATRRTEVEQLRTLTRIVGERFADPALLRGGPFAGWEALFGYLLDKVGDDRFLFVIDEFPYLESTAPALPSVLQSLFDHQLRESRMKLVLAGSHISVMKRLEEADQPLYARRTGRILFSPFSYLDAAGFIPGYGAADRIRTYGIFGGVPGHLALVDPREDLATNVQRQLLDPASRLHDEAQRVLDAFLGEAHVHYSIIEAIAAGERTWSGISRRVGRGSGSLSRPVSWLTEMEVIRREVPITVRRPEKSKRALYTLTDPYLAFWHRFVSPLIQAGVPGTVPNERIWDRAVRPGLDDYMGPVFEEVCRDAMRERPQLPPFEPFRIGGWWSPDSRDEVDVVVLSETGEILVGECKWGPVDGADLETLRRRADLVVSELEGVSRVHLALFSGRGSRTRRSGRRWSGAACSSSGPRTSSPRAKLAGVAARPPRLRAGEPRPCGLPGGGRHSAPACPAGSGALPSPDRPSHLRSHGRRSGP